MPKLDRSGRGGGGAMCPQKNNKVEGEGGLMVPNFVICKCACNTCADLHLMTTDPPKEGKLQNSQTHTQILQKRETFPNEMF